MIFLTAKTHKGKNVIAKWGNEWEKFNDDNRPGKMLIKAIIDDSGVSHSDWKLGLGGFPDSIRCVRIVGDTDFDITIGE